jgi:hypothetical protein
MAKATKKLADEPVKKLAASIVDRGQAVSRMEPMLVSEGSKHRGHLNE